MQRDPSLFIHPIDIRQVANHLSAASTDEGPGTSSTEMNGTEPGDSRKDLWEGQWFRIHLEPFWARFLKKGIEEQILDAAHYRIFFLLTTLMGSRNEVYQTQEEMAGLVHLKPSRVSEVLRDLDDLGCIQRIGGRSKGAFIRLDPALVTRSSRVTHQKVVNEWNSEVIFRVAKQKKNADIGVEKGQEYRHESNKVNDNSVPF